MDTPGFRINQNINKSSKFKIPYIANSSGEMNVQDLHQVWEKCNKYGCTFNNTTEDMLKVADLAFLALPHNYGLRTF